MGSAWLAPFGRPEFWNPKNRSPECFNPPAALSVLPYDVKATGTVLAGFSKTQIFDGIKAAVDKKELGAPAGVPIEYAERVNRELESISELLLWVNASGEAEQMRKGPVCHQWCSAP